MKGVRDHQIAESHQTGMDLWKEGRHLDLEALVVGQTKTYLTSKDTNGVRSKVHQEVIPLEEDLITVLSRMNTS